MDLLAYTVKYFKENDVIQHDSLEEEIDFLTQKVNEIKNKQHELNVNYSEIMKCTEDEIKQKYVGLKMKENNNLEKKKKGVLFYIIISFIGLFTILFGIFFTLILIILKMITLKTYIF